MLNDSGLTDEQWERIRDLFRRRILAMDVLGANRLRRVVFFELYCGFSLRFD
jgi:hypothetical protein